ncbi:histidinol-phosphate transaminase [soil metagenome]
MAVGKELVEGPHGGDGLRVARALGIDPRDLLDLSASLNPTPPPVADIVARHLWLTRHYPDAEAAHERFAHELGVDVARLVLTNGGSEAIALVAAVLRRGTVIEPEFSLYRRHLDHVDGVDDAADGTATTRWRSNPNNPLGTTAASDALAAVWDEAYWPMTAGTWTSGDDASWRLGSLTKLWACPGLRLGYAIAPSAAAAGQIRDLQSRWSVNALALAALPDLLDHDDLPSTARRLAARRLDFTTAAQQLGYVTRPGVAPWLLLEGTSGLRDRLAALGIVVRDCTSYGMPGVHRVALPPDGTVDRVLTALDHVRA